jgi:hypothetical protein
VPGKNDEIIAVNKLARENGVSRDMSEDEAMDKCSILGKQLVPPFISHINLFIYF